MITLERIGDVIRFTFQNNPLYLNDGTIEVPVNSLSLLIDESNIATFKKAASNDIFLSCSLDELGMTKAQLINWYKDNMVDEGMTPEEVEDIVESATTNLFGFAEYDSQSTRINFKHDASGSVISSIDASDFVIDGMIDNVEIVTVEGVKYLQITFNTESGKEPILIPLADIFNPDNYYTKTATDALLAAKADTATTYTKTATDALLANKADTATTYTKSEVDSAISAATSGKVDTDVFDEKERAVSTALNDLNERKLDASAYTPTDLSNYYTKSETDGEIEEAVSGKADSNTVYTKSEANALLADKADTATTYTKSEVDTALSGKQNTLVAGTNITISGNVISAEGGSGGSTFNENFSVPEYADYADGGVQYNYFNTFPNYSCYVKIGVVQDHGTIIMTDDTSGEDVTYNIFSSGDTITATTSTGEIILNSFSFERVDGIDRMVKITQTANTSNNIYAYSTSNAEFYGEGYIIPSGTTENAIKISAQESLDIPLRKMMDCIKNIDFVSINDKKLSIYLTKFNGGQVGGDVCLLNNQEILYTSEGATTPDNQGLNIKKIVDNTVGWSVIGVSDDTQFIDTFYYPSTSYGFEKTKFNLDTNLTLENGWEFQISYIDDNGNSVESSFVYDSSSDEFITEDSNFNVIKTNNYIEIDYVGSNLNNNFRFDHYTSWDMELRKGKVNSVEVYGNRLFNLQESYNNLSSRISGNTTALSGKQDTLVSGTNIKTINNESILGSGNIVIQGGGSSYTAGDGIDITNDVISVTGKVDTSAITTSMTSGSTDSQVPSAKAVYDNFGGLKLVKLTQAQYNALSVKDPMTLYVIADDVVCAPESDTWVTVGSESVNYNKPVYNLNLSGTAVSEEYATSSELTHSISFNLYSEPYTGQNFDYVVDVEFSNVPMAESYSLEILNAAGVLVYSTTDDTENIDLCQILGGGFYLDGTDLPSITYCVSTECTEYECLEYDEETGECIEEGECISTECTNEVTEYPLIVKQ